jgi:hypothetical protein
LLLLSLVACGSDYSVTNMCLGQGSGFDVEEVSTLQDAAGYPGARDAVVLQFDDSGIGEGESWRVTGVELLVMVPEWVFNDYDGGDKISVNVWDAERPRGEGDWTVTEAIDPGSLDWEKVTLPRDAYWASQRDELEQRRAWMHFGFADVVPEAGMTSSTYTVAVSWGNKGLPTIGYSNFNLACDQNWTDYGDGSWTLNSADGDGQSCSWPMMRVSVETRTLSDGACEEGTVAI